MDRLGDLTGRTGVTDLSLSGSAELSEFHSVVKKTGAESASCCESLDGGGFTHRNCRNPLSKNAKRKQPPTMLADLPAATQVVSDVPFLAEFADVGEILGVHLHRRVSPPMRPPPGNKAL